MLTCYPQLEISIHWFVAKYFCREILLIHTRHPVLIYLTDPFIKQIKDPSFAPRFPPCARYGCGKREMYMGEERTPYSYLASKIRQLQRKRAVGIDPPCARYACGKRK